MNDQSDTALHVPDCDRHVRCGGCSLMRLGNQAQRTEKSRRFAADWQAAGLPAVPLAWVHCEGGHLGYRNRVRCQVTPDGLVRFFNPEKVDACPVLDPSVRAGVELAKRIALEHPSAMRHFASLEVRGHDSLDRGAIRYRSGLPSELHAADPAEIERACAELLAAWPAPWLVAGLDRGPVPRQRWNVTDGVWAEIPIDAFMQINARVNRRLVSHVRDGIAERGAQSFADLFMGAGNFSLPLLALGLDGYSVEAHAGAVGAALHAARAQGLSFAAADAGDTTARALAWIKAGISVDVVIADPPRAGLGSAVVPVTRLARRTVVLCSCNPRSLVRDVAALLAEGFRVERVTLFEMFPQTPHLESVVWLERIGRPAQLPSNIFS